MGGLADKLLPRNKGLLSLVLKVVYAVLLETDGKYSH